MNILIFFLGASFGSFICLVIDRFPEQSLLWPASHCDKCQTRLAFFDLIPIVSQLINKSKCRYCRTKIPYYYFLVETSFACLSLLAYLQIISFNQLIMLGLSIILSCYDIKSHSFPIVIGLVGYLSLFITNHFSIWSLFILIAAIVIEMCSLNIGFGSGDLLYIAILSLLLPLHAIIWIIQIASLLGITCFILKKDKELPFIPHLSLAYVIIIYFFQ